MELSNNNQPLQGEVIDALNVARYQENIWHRRYGSGLYFSALEEVGDKIDIPIGVEKDGLLKWYRTPHALHDGYSALNVLKKEKGIRLDLPRFEKRVHKGFFKSLFSALSSRPSQYHHFIDQSDLRGVEFDHRVIELPLNQTGYSTTTLVLNSISKILMRELTTNTISRWMIPVRLKQSDGLNASYIGLEVDYKDSIEFSTNMMRLKLKSGEHWGYYYLSKIGLLLGKKVITLLTKKSVLSEKTKWMGSISNLGNLGASEDIDQLYVLHPVRWHRPIGIILYELNGKQYVTLSVHKSLSKVNLDGIVNEFKESYKSHTSHK